MMMATHPPPYQPEVGEYMSEYGGGIKIDVLRDDGMQL
jgi:hypothetical protein